MPIIPLVDPLDPRADEQIERPVPWDDLKMDSEQLKRLRTKVRARTKLVSTSLIDQYSPAWYLTLGAKAASLLLRSSIVDHIMERIRNALDKYDLYGAR